MDKKQNKPFQVDDNGVSRIIWESRSMASSVFVFTKDKEGYWRVLANERGPGCPDFVGFWVCPCGYLDYGETLKGAAVRECYEETGVLIGYYNIKEYNYNDSPEENRQNVTHRFYTVVNNGFDYAFSKKNNEENEVNQIAWVRLDLLDNFRWAFGHKEIILDIFNKRINIPWWKKFVLNIYEKYVK